MVQGTLDAVVSGKQRAQGSSPTLPSLDPLLPPPCHFSYTQRKGGCTAGEKEGQHNI